MSSTEIGKLSIQPPPATQALSSTTFTPPPLDGSLTIPELAEWHYKRSANHPVFIYDDAGSIKTLYWSDWYPAIHRAARYVRKAFDFATPETSADRPVIAILANADLITYATTQMGIVQAEGVSFAVSPRNSAIAVAHLLEKTRSKYLLVSEDFRPLAEAAITSMKNPPPIAYLPSFHNDLFLEKDEGFEFLPQIKHKNIHDPVTILHSSGSTAFPKPITFSHLLFQCAGRLFYYGERDLTGVVFSGHSLGAFHGTGLSITQFWTIGSGTVAAVFKPTIPAITPTPDLIYDASVATKSEFVLCPPVFIEMWSQKPEQLNYFKTIQGLWYAGAPLKKSVGDILHAQGIPLYQLYGSTETSTLTLTLPKGLSPAWEYFQFSSHIKPHFVPDGFGAFELIVEATPEFTPAHVNTKIGDADAYATKDLLTPHPTLPGYWKIYGRADDQLTHSDTLKTNPVPLEAILNSDPHIQASVMFGQGKSRPGVIIDPRAPHQFDPSDKEKLSEFKNKIWPTVEKMNAYAPEQSRFSKEMILVSSPSRPFVYTAKLTARRQTVITDYDEEIQALYTAKGEIA